ncbi:hypothetical protein DFH09DRAFT_1114141 [Mycena vulgaris]|nr:hypothetical protein DFH09DRAFT_1114141 [Mycena vulgaris]
MPPSRRKKAKKMKFTSEGLTAAIASINQLAKRARTTALTVREQQKIRFNLATIVNNSDYPDEGIATLDAILQELESSKVISTNEIKTLTTAAPFVPDDTMSPEEHEAWMDEVAASRAVSSGPRRVPSPFTGTPAEAELREQIVQIGTRAGATNKWLRMLDAFAETTSTGFSVSPRPILFDDANKRKGVFGSPSFASFGAMSSFLKNRPRRCEFSLALAIVWTENPTGKNFDNWCANDLHAIPLVIVHPPAGAPVRSAGPRKVMVVADPNVASATTAEPFSARLNTLISTGNAPATKFINLPRSERNGTGICLTLALEWMLELVAAGLEVTRDEKGDVADIAGFQFLEGGLELKKDHSLMADHFPKKEDIININPKGKVVVRQLNWDYGPNQGRHHSNDLASAFRAANCTLRTGESFLQNFNQK